MPSQDNSVPILEKGRKNIDAWERKFNDYCILKKWRGILLGSEARPIELTPVEVNAIPAASRYTASRDRLREMEDFNDRSEAAFAGICKAMQDDPLIYASAELDLLRQAVQHDPVAAYTYILACLRPSHVDAQMTAELRIAAFALLKGETVPASYQRLLSYVNCLDAANRPDDNTLKRHMKRAIKGDDAATKLYMSKLESMMDREPPIDFAAFCQGLLRKYEEHTAETAQEAALNTESKQSSIHHESEKETVMYSQGKGGRGGKGKGGRGGRGKGRSMGKGQADARIGAMYYGKGGYGEDYDGYGYYAEQQPFYRGGYRHNGGRGYQLDGKGSSSGGKSHYQDSNKRQYDNAGGGKGKGGKSSESAKPKFQGYCNRCSNWGHKEADCYAKKPRV